MKTKLVFGGLIVLVLAFLAWFGIGGGFSDVPVKVKKNYVLNLYGVEFEGSLKSKEVSSLFVEVEQELKGKPMYVFYEGLPSKENDYTVKMFVGGLVQFNKSIQKHVFFKEVFTARHDSHYMLNKSQTRILNKAKEDGVALDLSKMIEVYHTKNDIEVIVPIALD